MESQIEFICTVDGKEFKVWELLHETKEFYRIQECEDDPIIHVFKKYVSWVQFK